MDTERWGGAEQDRFFFVIDKVKGESGGLRRALVCDILTPTFVAVLELPEFTV